MKENIMIKDGIFWIGALDYDIKVFDIIMETKYGTTYNAYLVKGKTKTALFETVKEKFFDEFLERLNQISSVEEIDYLVVDHTEPDHAGSISKLLALNPNITIIGSNIALKYLAEIANVPFKSIAVKQDDEIDLGGKTLSFISAPNLHWPDSMYTYIKEDQVLMTCDSFGCHYCTDIILNDLMESDLLNHDFMDAYQYYFDCIMSPFKPFVLKAIEKIEPLDLQIICPGHGPVLRKDLDKYVDLYKKWSTPPPAQKPYVVIAYVSAYGYTKALAEKIRDGIANEGIEVRAFDLVESQPQEVLAQMEQAAGLLFGSPTLLSDALPPIWNLLTTLNPLIHKGKFAGAFGSYGWSGEAVPNIEERLNQLRFKVPIKGLKVNFNPTSSQLEDAFSFGKSFAIAIKMQTR